MTITYHDLRAKLKVSPDDTQAKVPLQVRLDGKVVGLIRHVAGGFAYYPKGASKYKGDTFATIDEVKRSLESPELGDAQA